MLLDIENDIGVVVMANADNADPAAIAVALLKTVIASREIADVS